VAIFLRQSKATQNTDVDGSISVVLDSAPSEGNLLVAYYAARGTGNNTPTFSGWTAGPVFLSPAFDGGCGLLFRKVAGAGESATITILKGASTYGSLTVMEFGGVDAYDAEDSADSVSAATSLSAGPLSAASGSILVVGAFVQAARSATYTWGSGYTEVAEHQVNSSGPASTVGYKVISGASGTQTATATSTESDGYGWGMLSFTGLSLPPGVYVDWDDDGFSTVTDDITSHVASVRIQQGASPEITGGAQIGTCEVILNNPTDDRYNPMNASGPLYGLLRDGRAMWAGIATDGTFSGVTPAGLFGGRVQSITPDPTGGAGRAVKVSLTGQDALAWYGRTPARVEDGLFRSQKALRQAILTAAGETRTSLANETHTMPISSWDGDALRALEQLNSANGTRHWIRPATNPDLWYDYVTRNRQWRLDTTNDASLDAGTDHVTSMGGWGYTADTVINQQKASIVPVTFTPGSVTVWEAPTLPIVVTSTTPRTIWVEFDAFVTDPVVDKAYSGTSPSVTLTAYGSTAKLEITSAGTTTISALSIEGVLLRRGPTESVVIDDTTSQSGSRGVRAGSEISGEWVGVLASARGIAEHVVWRYGEPQYRPTLTVTNWFPEMFTIGLYDVIALTVDTLAMTARRFEVIGRTIDIAVASAAVQSATVTYVLQESRVQADPGWFVLDTSELDSTDVLGY